MEHHDDAEANTTRVGDYTVSFRYSNVVRVCYYDHVEHVNLFWEDGINDFPFFNVQISAMMLTSSLLFAILKPFHQRRFVAEILSGIALGSSMIIRSDFGQRYMHAMKTYKVLETMGNFGLLYYMFLVGLEMDLTTILYIGNKALCNALIGILLPLSIGLGTYFLMVQNKAEKDLIGATFWATSLTVTSFPDLARVLSDLKLLHTDIGRFALSSAFVNDLAAWPLFVLAVTIHTNFFMVFFTFAFLLLCWFVLRPALSWAINNCSTKGESVNDLHVHLILIGVILCGFLTDACGSSSMIGAFMFGLIIPNGEITLTLIEKLEFFMSGIMLPAFFLIIGVRFDLYSLNKDIGIVTLVVIVVLACLAKVISALISSLIYGIPVRDGLTLGVLMNTKGVLALIILNMGRNKRDYDEEIFTTMIIAISLMTLLVKPVMIATYNSSKHSIQYKHSIIRKGDLDSELRILACIHSTCSLSGIINLLEVSNATRESPICVFSVHLVELIGRTIGMLIVHEKTTPTKRSVTRERADSNYIMEMFQNYVGKLGDTVSVQPLTIVSPYTTMHEDVCRLAKDKRVNLILVPFHKRPNVGGLLNEGDCSLRAVNLKVLKNSPCSIGILIDRGFGLKNSLEEIGDETLQRYFFVMIFIGGPDDREALSYAWRMAGTPRVNLTVVRLIPNKDMRNKNIEKEEILSTTNEVDDEELQDNEYINEFRFKTMHDQTIIYVEKIINSTDETITTLATLFSDCDLFIVGRGRGRTSPLTLGLLEWNETENLGALTDILLTSEFAKQASILVVQQFSAGASDDDSVGRGDCNDGCGLVRAGGSKDQQEKMLTPTSLGGNQWGLFMKKYFDCKSHEMEIS